MSAEAVFSVSGMTCGACTASITKALLKQGGVKDVSVSLITEEGKIIFDDCIVTVDKLKAIIEDCGFDARLLKSHSLLMKTAVSIQGMTCGACSASITEALENLDGVDNVSVSLVTENGSIIHKPSVPLDLIKETIENCGFDVQIESSKAALNPSKKEGGIHKTTLAIRGITCSACTASITEALEKTENVLTVSVSLITEEALVTHNNQINPEKIQGIIEDCGFEAKIINPRLANGEFDEEEEEQISLQIYGITDSTDLVNLQYNIEAILNSSGGIICSQIAFKSSSNQSIAPLVTDSNSSSIQAIRSIDNQEVYDDENFIDELSITYNPQLIGIRELVDGLNNITDEIRYIVVNSVDQSSASQLKLLSRVKDIQYWKSNFWKSVLFGLPVIVLSHTQHLSIWRKLMIFPGFYLVSLLQFVLTVPIQFKLGAVFNKKFIQFIKNGGKNATMDVLVCISTSISFIFSVLSIVLSVWLGQTEKPPKLLLDTSSMLITFISFGKWLENKAKGATSTALSKLLSLTPTICTIISDIEKYEKFMSSLVSEKKEIVTDMTTDIPTRNISIDLIQTNDIAIVLPGGKVPADGIIVFGESEIDESLITGESLPVFKKKGDQVIGGSINGPDLIHIKVIRSGKKSQLQQIINLVKDSQVNKAPVQRFADYIAARFVPAVLFLALTTFSFWLLICYNVDYLPMVFKKDENGKYFVCLKLAISVIVVACPCALGLAAPTAVMVGTGVGASHGVLIKGGDILEKASNIDIILFDKTGTLTTGDMVLTNFKQLFINKIDCVDWWKLVGSVECNSEHPTGKAIAKRARQELGITFEEDTFDTVISGFKTFPGLGIKANIQLPNHPDENFSVFIGSNKMIHEHFKLLIPILTDHLSGTLDNSINTLVHVIINDMYCGFMELSDSLKPNAKDIIDYLQYEQHYKVGIVTGDNERAANKVGEELGIPPANIFSEISPVHKDKVIVDLKERFSNDRKIGVAFVGDGINDAPALAQADIGMAISSGTDIAIESADIVLIGNTHGQTDLLGVPIALNISQVTFNRIKMNFIWAAIYNLIMLPFAMGCFLPVNIMLPPIAAGGAMALSSVSVVISSLLLQKWKPPTIIGSNILSKADLETNIGNVFNLKDSSDSNLNPISDNRKSSSKFFNIFKRFKKPQSRTSYSYELLPTN